MTCQNVLFFAVHVRIPRLDHVGRRAAAALAGTHSHILNDNKTQYSL